MCGWAKIWRNTPGVVRQRRKENQHSRQRDCQHRQLPEAGRGQPLLRREGDPLFEKLQSIIDNDLVLDDLKTDIVEVKLWDAQSSGAFPAVREECYIEVSSYGGDTTGYQIPFNVHYTGVKTKGTFNPTTKAFTAEA